MFPKIPIMITRSAGTEPAYAVVFPASPVRTVTPVSPRYGSKIPGPLRQDRVQLDQRGADSDWVVSFGEYWQHIATIAGTEAEHRDGSLDVVKRVSDVGPHLAEAPGEVGVWVVVGVVPLHVVAHAASMNESGRRCELVRVGRLPPWACRRALARSHWAGQEFDE
jgi:hypothetical protein